MKNYKLGHLEAKLNLCIRKEVFMFCPKGLTLIWYADIWWMNLIDAFSFFFFFFEGGSGMEGVLQSVNLETHHIHVL